MDPTEDFKCAAGGQSEVVAVTEQKGHSSTPYSILGSMSFLDSREGDMSLDSGGQVGVSRESSMGTAILPPAFSAPGEDISESGLIGSQDGARGRVGESKGSLSKSGTNFAERDFFCDGDVCKQLSSTNDEFSPVKIGKDEEDDCKPPTFGSFGSHEANRGSGDGENGDGRSGDIFLSKNKFCSTGSDGERSGLGGRGRQERWPPRVKEQFGDQVDDECNLPMRGDEENAGGAMGLDEGPTECSGKFLDERLFPQLGDGNVETLSEEAFNSALEAIDLLEGLQESQLEDFISLLEQPWDVNHHIRLARQLAVASNDILGRFVQQYDGFSIIDRWLNLGTKWKSDELVRTLLKVIEKVIKCPESEFLYRILDSGVLASLRALQWEANDKLASKSKNIITHLKFFAADSQDRRISRLKEALVDKCNSRKREISEVLDLEEAEMESKANKTEPDLESKAKKRVTWADEDTFQKIEFYKSMPVRKLENGERNVENDLPRQRISWHTPVPLNLKNEYKPVITEATLIEDERESKVPRVIYSSVKDIPDVPNELSRSEFEVERSKYESTPYPTEIPFSPISQLKGGNGTGDGGGSSSTADYKKPMEEILMDLQSQKKHPNANISAGIGGNAEHLRGPDPKLYNSLNLMNVSNILSLLNGHDPNKINPMRPNEFPNEAPNGNNSRAYPYPENAGINTNALLLENPKLSSIIPRILNEFKSQPMSGPSKPIPPSLPLPAHSMPPHTNSHDLSFIYNSLNHYPMPQNIAPNAAIQENTLRILSKLISANIFENPDHLQKGVGGDPSRFPSAVSSPIFLHPNDISPTLFQLKRVTKAEDIHRHLCKNWREGSCSFGAKCHFLHYWPYKSYRH